MMVRSSPRGVLIAIVLLLGLIGSAAAKRPLSYCKCVCGPARNYTIAHLLQPTNPSRPCADCTRAFCFDQGVQECPEESRDDTLFAVSTECFQRESRKDEVIIVAFLLTTGGLLLYATVIKTFLARRQAQPVRYRDIPVR